MRQTRPHFTRVLAALAFLAGAPRSAHRTLDVLEALVFLEVLEVLEVLARARLTQTRLLPLRLVGAPRRGATICAYYLFAGARLPQTRLLPFLCARLVAPRLFLVAKWGVEPHLAWLFTAQFFFITYTLFLLLPHGRRLARWLAAKGLLLLCAFDANAPTTQHILHVS